MYTTVCAVHSRAQRANCRANGETLAAATASAIQQSLDTENMMLECVAQVNAECETQIYRYYPLIYSVEWFCSCRNRVQNSTHTHSDARARAHKIATTKRSVQENYSLAIVGQREMHTMRISIPWWQMRRTVSQATHSYGADGEAGERERDVRCSRILRWVVGLCVCVCLKVV